MSQKVSDWKPSINSTEDSESPYNNESTPLNVTLELNRQYYLSQVSHVSSDIQKFRLKYLCKHSWSTFFQYIWKRLPSGRATYFILFMCFLERLSYYYAVGDVMDPFLKMYDLTSVERSLLKGLLLNTFANLMFPFVGWLADVWVGRYRMIHMGLWFMWLGYASVAIAFSLEPDDASSIHDNRNRYILLVSFLVINFGSAAFQANAIPFGADQIAYKSSEELSSYFYCYYWVRNFAYFLTLLFTCSDSANRWYGIVFGYISTFSITVALALNAVCSKTFFIDMEKRNPLKVMFKVLSSALVTKRPRYRSAFSYGGAKMPSRIDLVKRTHGGKFTTEDVEDTKTFGRLILISFSLAGGLIVWNSIVDTTKFEEKSMLHGKDADLQIKPFTIFQVLKGCTTFSLIELIEALVLLIAIPLFNSCIFPFLRDYTPNMLRRIGFGYLLAILSVASLLVITIAGQLMDNPDMLRNATKVCVLSNNIHPVDINPLPITVYFLVIPNSLIVLAEVFLNISSLEFFYAQSPHTMRGMMIGVYFFEWGLASSLANLIFLGFSLISQTKGPPVTCQMWYYLLLLIIVVAYFVIYIFVARWYQNRKRLTEQEEEVFYRA